LIGVGCLLVAIGVGLAVYGAWYGQKEQNDCHSRSLGTTLSGGLSFEDCSEDPGGPFTIAGAVVGGLGGVGVLAAWAVKPNPS